MEAELDSVFAALSDPTRRRIVELVASGEPRTTKQLAAMFPFTRWAVMKHLAVLRDARLIQTLPQGRRRLHFVDRRVLAAAAEWLASQGKPSG